MLEWIYYRADSASTAPAHPIVECVKHQIAAVTKTKPLLARIPSPSDLRFLILYSGTPTVKIGPLGGAGDMPDEWVDVGDYVRAVKVTAGIILEWCGTKARSRN